MCLLPCARAQVPFNDNAFRLCQLGEGVGGWDWGLGNMSSSFETSSIALVCAVPLGALYSSLEVAPAAAPVTARSTFSVGSHKSLPLGGLGHFCVGDAHSIYNLGFNCSSQLATCNWQLATSCGNEAISNCHFSWARDKSHAFSFHKIEHLPLLPTKMEFLQQFTEDLSKN